MLQTPVHDVIAPAPADLAEVRDLYLRGLCLQAYERAKVIGPLHRWRGAEARVLAGRLAMNLGAPRQGSWHHVHAFREDPADPEARYYYARVLLERRGPLRAWGFLQRSGALPAAPAPIHSDWLAFHACVLSVFRDFEAAEQWLRRAEEACPGRPWTCIERAHLLELEDRYEESLAAARQSLELKPWYRPGVQATAHVLQLLDRDREALDLLTEADRRIESAPVVAQLAVLQTELGHYEDARRSHARFAEMAPLIEKAVSQWLFARRSDAAYYVGDFAEAAEFARQVKEPFYDKLAERLAAPEPEGKRIVLDVGFVRQHHQTCVPATLAAISRFWKMPADHLEVAAAICYDGTPDHRERLWAEEHGWLPREFSVTWDAAAGLIDRGVPFTLTTTEPTNSHLQAVIGYDGRRNSFLVRDPYLRYMNEFIAEPLLERYRSIGPRGMALVPRDRADRLDGLTLPDAGLYDQVYRLQRALQVHDRAAAAGVLAAMQTEAPGHRLTLQARRLLAIYDADQTELLASIERLLELFPEDPLLELGKLACLRHLARREERLELLRTICARPQADPVFWRTYAQELTADAREHRTATRLLRRAIRYRPLDPGNLASLANLLWDQRRFDEALELYRFAACLDDKDEGLARSYFTAARHRKQADATLAFLTRRFERFGARSSQPARTLYWAYSQYERTHEAVAVLEKALQLRPEDGELMLFAAEAYAGHGEFDRADALLKTAEGRAPRAARLRTAASLAGARGDLAAALGLWRQVLEAEPLALDAHRSVTQLLAETESRAAALEHQRQACDRFPHNYALHQLWIEWLRLEGAPAEEPVVRRLIAIHPADAWARRELALVLGGQGRFEEAFAELDVAHGLEPANSSYFSVRGQVCAQAGRLEEAREAYREAIRLSVDNEFAIGRLLEACDTLAERRAALAFVEQELVRQVIFGDGLLAYQQFARRTLEPDELLRLLRDALAARPDLWHAWSAVVRQLIEVNQTDEALDLARRATARFPLLPRLWFDLAAVCQARKDAEGEKDALRHALQINPGWGEALRRLAEIHDREGRPDEAKAVLEQAVARSPLECLNHGCLADRLWRSGDKEGAVARVQQAVLLEPGYEWAWGALRDWSRELGRPGLAVEVARDLTARRGGEARSWMMLARVLGQPEDLNERLAAIDRALELNPRLFEGHDLKAELLAQAGRFDEALAACSPTAWGPQPPLALRGRAAWVEAQRGDVARAVERMRAVVAEDTNYYWGWSNLADWYRDTGAGPEYLEAANHLVRLAPHNPVALGYRGDARLRTGDRAGAKEDLRHAVEVAPDYPYAGMTLFDEQFADGEFEAAGQTLELLKKHVGGDYVLARQVRWAVHDDDRLAALEHLEQLCVSRTEDTWPLEAAVATLREAGWAVSAERVVREALDKPEVNPHVGSVWVGQWTARGNWGCARELDGLLTRGEVGRRALLTYLQILGRGKHWYRLAYQVYRRREQLRADAVFWGTAGYAFATADAPRSTAFWMRDWAGRADLKPWMLINLVLALRALGRDRQAGAVSRHTLTLPADYTTPYHRLWLAYDEALAGNTAAAAEVFDGLNPAPFDATNRFLHALVEAVLAVQRADPGKRPDVFREVQARLVEAAAACSPLAEDRAAVRRAYVRSVRRLAKDCGTWRARLWSWYRGGVPCLPRIR